MHYTSSSRWFKGIAILLLMAALVSLWPSEAEAGFFSWLKKAFKAVFETIGGVVKSAVNGLKTAVNTVVSGVKTAVKTVADVAVTVGKGIASVAKSVANAAKAVGSLAVNTVKNVAVTVGNTAKTLVTNPLKAIDVAYKGVTDTARQIARDSGAAFEKSVNAMTTFSREVTNVTAAAASLVGTGLNNRLSSAMLSVNSTLTNSLDRAAQVANKASQAAMNNALLPVDVAYNTAKNTTNVLTGKASLTDGVMASLDFAGNQAASVATAQVKNAAELGRISYEAQIGVAGAVASEAAGAMAGDSARDLVLQATDAAREASESIANDIGDVVKIAASGVNTAVNTVRSGVKTAVEAVEDVAVAAGKGVVSVAKSVANAAVSVGSLVVNTAKNIGVTVANTAKALVTNPLNAIDAAYTGITDTARQIARDSGDVLEKSVNVLTTASREAANVTAATVSLVDTGLTNRLSSAMLSVNSTLTNNLDRAAQVTNKASQATLDYALLPYDVMYNTAKNTAGVLTGQASLTDGFMNSLDFAAKQSTAVATAQVKNAAELGRIVNETQIGVASAVASEAVGAVACDSAREAILTVADGAQEVSETINKMGENVGTALASQNAASVTQNLIQMSPQEAGMAVYDSTVKPYVDFSLSTGKFVKNSFNGELEWQDARQWLLDTSTAVRTTAMIAGAVVSGGAALTALAVANLAAVSTSAVLNIVESPDMNTIVYEGANLAVARVTLGQARDVAAKQAMQKQLVAKGMAKEAAEAQVTAMFKNKVLAKEVAALGAKSVAEQFDPDADNNAGFNVETLTGILTTAAASYQLSSAAEAVGGHIPTKIAPQITKAMNAGIETAIMSGSEVQVISKNLMLGMGGQADAGISTTPLASGMATQPMLSAAAPTGGVIPSLSGAPASGSSAPQGVAGGTLPGGASAPNMSGFAPSGGAAVTAPGAVEIPAITLLPDAASSAAALTETVNQVLSTTAGMTSQLPPAGAPQGAAAQPGASPAAPQSPSDPDLDELVQLARTIMRAKETPRYEDKKSPLGLRASKVPPPETIPSRTDSPYYIKQPTIKTLETEYFAKLDAWWRAKNGGASGLSPSQQQEAEQAIAQYLVPAGDIPDPQMTAMTTLGETLAQKIDTQQLLCGRPSSLADFCIPLMAEVQQLKQDLTDGLASWSQQTDWPAAAAEAERIKLDILARGDPALAEVLTLSDTMAAESAAFNLKAQRIQAENEQILADAREAQKAFEAGMREEAAQNEAFRQEQATRIETLAQEHARLTAELSSTSSPQSNQEAALLARQLQLTYDTMTQNADNLERQQNALLNLQQELERKNQAWQDNPSESGYYEVKTLQENVEAETKKLEAEAAWVNRVNAERLAYAQKIEQQLNAITQNTTARVASSSSTVRRVWEIQREIEAVKEETIARLKSSKYRSVPRTGVRSREQEYGATAPGTAACSDAPGRIRREDRVLGARAKESGIPGNRQVTRLCRG